MQTREGEREREKEKKRRDFAKVCLVFYVLVCKITRSLSLSLSLASQRREKFISYDVYKKKIRLQSSRIRGSLDVPIQFDTLVNS